MKNSSPKNKRQTIIFILLCIVISVLTVDLLTLMRYKLRELDHPLYKAEHHPYQDTHDKSQHVTENTKHRSISLKIHDYKDSIYPQYKSRQVFENSSLTYAVTNTSLPVGSGDLKAENCDNSLETLPMICRNLSLDSISHMRAESAKWQPLKTNVTCHFYSAFWETRPLGYNEVRVIGMAQRKDFDDIWCHLWFEKQCQPTTRRAILRRKVCPKCQK